MLFITNRWLLSGLIVVMCVFSKSSAGLAQPAPPPKADFSVTVPPDALRAVAGSNLATSMKVTNSLEVTIHYSIATVPVVAENQGRMSLGGEANPVLLNTSVDGRVAVPPGQGVDVPISVRIPNPIRPDIYFVGFLVKPDVAPTAGGPAVQLQVVQHIAIEVTGEADRDLVARVSTDRRLNTNGRTSGEVNYENEGTAGLQVRRGARLEKVAGYGADGAAITMEGSPIEILPAGGHKSLAYRHEAQGFTAGLFRVEATGSFTGAQDVVVTSQAQGPLVLVATRGGAVVMLLAALVVLVTLLFICWQFLHISRRKSSTSRPNMPIDER